MTDRALLLEKKQPHPSSAEGVLYWSFLAALRAAFLASRSARLRRLASATWASASERRLEVMPL